MRMMLKSAVAVMGAAALAMPALAQQGAPPPGAQGAPPAGAQGAPRQGGGPGGGAGRARPAPPPPNTGIALSASLAGRGTGYIGAVIDPPAGQLCYILNIANTDPPTMAHIHQGAMGQDGPVVFPLQTPVNGSSGGCSPIAADLAQRILANPRGYYVNVHTAAQPNGAIRGQLSR